MDVFSKKKRSEIMSKIKSKDTKIEILFRKALWKKGFRYRKNSSKYFGKPDLVLPKYKTVIFIDSCFWHNCPKHGYLPKSNLRYWRKKIERNKEESISQSKPPTPTSSQNRQTLRRGLREKGLTVPAEIEMTGDGIDVRREGDIRKYIKLDT